MTRMTRRTRTRRTIMMTTTRHQCARQIDTHTPTLTPPPQQPHVEDNNDDEFRPFLQNEGGGDSVAARPKSMVGPCIQDDEPRTGRGLCTGGPPNNTRLGVRVRANRYTRTPNCSKPFQTHTHTHHSGILLSLAPFVETMKDTT